jgi:hypothetical protein
LRIEAPQRHDPHGASPEMPWSTPFDDPISLRGDRRLTTLQQAADYINSRNRFNSKSAGK